ncbi:hypothetical protein MT418_008223 [Batrachochytrium dendrobatidis]
MRISEHQDSTNVHQLKEAWVVVHQSGTKYCSSTILVHPLQTLDDLRDRILQEFATVFQEQASPQLIVQDSNGEEILSGTLVSNMCITNTQPLRVTVAQAMRAPVIKNSYGGCRTSKGYFSCKAFLASIAASLELKYELVKLVEDRTATFVDIQWNVKQGLATRRKGTLVPLNKVFDQVQWGLLGRLHDAVHDDFHHEMQLERDGKHKTVMMPQPFYLVAETMQSIAHAAGVVNEKSDLVVIKEP